MKSYKKQAALAEKMFRRNVQLRKFLKHAGHIGNDIAPIYRAATTALDAVEIASNFEDVKRAFNKRADEVSHAATDAWNGVRKTWKRIRRWF